MNAVDGLDALEKAKIYKPDLIIMDINLPNLKGLEAATIIKSNFETKHIPIVILTAAQNMEYRKIAEKIGCAGYFTKPIDPLVFTDEIKRIAGSSDTAIEIDNVSVELSKSLEEKAKKVAQLGKELSKSERKFNAIVESVMDLIFIVDSNGFMDYANSWTLKYPFFSSYYKKNLDFGLFFDDPKEALTTIFNMGFFKNYKFRIENYIFIGNFIAFDEEILVTLKDITEIEQIAKKEKELDQMALIGRIASGVIHELNNPISAMKTYLDIYPEKILKNENKDTIVQEFADKLKKILEHMSDLVTNLTFFARNKNESPVKINLNNIIKELLSFAGYDLRRGNVDIKILYKEDLPPVLGVKSDVEQAILNILINAHDAVEASQKPEITVTTYENNEYVKISIKDNGKGIPDSIKNHIFEPFLQLKMMGNPQDLGLQLPKNNDESQWQDRVSNIRKRHRIYLILPKIKRKGC